MSDSRPSAERTLDYAHRFGIIHDRIVSDDRSDSNFHTKISNKGKADYICKANYIPPMAFSVDLPLPLEDWRLSDDVSKLQSGLYFTDLRQQFYEELLREQPELKHTDAWTRHAECEFWSNAFNFGLQKHTSGKLINDDRVLH